ncbi:MAG: four helix bundle protein [Pseudomonadota bacterium]
MTGDARKPGGHKDLRVWQEGILLVKDAYRLTAAFPRDELFGLTSQIRRAAVSVPSNIAEGAARSSRREFVRFLGIARGSLSELETQAIIARELGYTDCIDDLTRRIEGLFRLLSALVNSLADKSERDE